VRTQQPAASSKREHAIRRTWVDQPAFVPVTMVSRFLRLPPIGS
jgi:hypothetical protein